MGLRLVLGVLCVFGVSVTGVSVVDMAQDVFQVLGMWHGAQHEELQRLSEVTLLQCVSAMSSSSR